MLLCLPQLKLTSFHRVCVALCYITFISEANTMFYCVSLTTRMQNTRDTNRLFSLQSKYTRISNELERMMFQMCNVCVFAKSFPTCPQKNLEKKRAEHKQNLLIYFICKTFDARDLLSVKSRNRMGIAYIRDFLIKAKK